MKETLFELEQKIKDYNAEAYLRDIVAHFKGFYGEWLIRQQQMEDFGGRCPECDAEMDEWQDNIG
jgi:hypothetical protein